MATLSAVEPTSSFPPAHLLNWVYLTLASEHQGTQLSQDSIQLQNKLLSPVWSPMSAPHLYSYAGYSGGGCGSGNGGKSVFGGGSYGHVATACGNIGSSSSCSGIGASFLSGDTIGELAEHFGELGFERKSSKRPPSTYLCHLCFKKGHYIKDCPQ